MYYVSAVPYRSDDNHSGTMKAATEGTSEPFGPRDPPRSKLTNRHTATKAPAHYPCTDRGERATHKALTERHAAGEKQIEMEAGWGAEEGRAEEMESKKGRMLDPGVITVRETERGKEEKVQLEEKKKRGVESEGKKTLLPCNKIAMNMLWCF